MIDSFKKVIGYILLYILKYTPVVGPRVQEACNKEVRRKPHLLAFVADIFKTQELCTEAVEADPCTLKYVPYWYRRHGMCFKVLEKCLHPMRFIPDHLKAQEMCNKAVEEDPLALRVIPDQCKTQGMCDKAVRDDSSSLQYIPDWFVSRDGVDMGYDDSEYCDDEDNFFKWYDRYKKRKAQKASIKEELMPIAWHPSRLAKWLSVRL